MLDNNILIQVLEDVIAHLIGIAKSAEVLALRTDEPHNLREIRTIVHHAGLAKRQAADIRNAIKKEK